MKKEILLTALFALIIAGCQKPTEVQLVNESVFDVENVEEPDPTIERTAVDSTALLPKEQQKFAGFIELVSVRTDKGLGVESNIGARVVFESRVRSVVDPTTGRKKYYGFPLDTVRVNDKLMFARERIARNPASGFEYVRELPTYEPLRRYNFVAISTHNDSVGAFAVSVEAPENLAVQSPVGGQRILQNKDLELRWSGKGNLSFIISTVQIQNNQIRIIPILNVRAKRNEGHAVLPRKVLELLPKGIYVFTFVLSNRDERATVGNFRGKVLVQASSIHNVVVGLI